MSIHLMTGYETDRQIGTIFLPLCSSENYRTEGWYRIGRLGATRELITGEVKVRLEVHNPYVN